MNLLENLIRPIDRNEVEFYPPVGHFFDGLTQRCWIRIRLFSYRTKSQLRCRTNSLCLSGVFTRNGDNQGITVGYYLSARDTHAVDTLLQNRASLRQLVLGWLFTLWN